MAHFDGIGRQSVDDIGLASHETSLLMILWKECGSIFALQQVKCQT